MGREMVEYCAGLPLAIVMLGGILVTKPSLIEWEKVYRDTMLSLERGKELGEVYQHQLHEVLVWSYNDLPPQLKPCFLYLGKFNEDEWIEVETLYQLWIAEGMVLSSDKKNGETMMQVAESYLGELVHRSMVQVKHNDMESSLTKFKSCSLHDLMRDLSLSQAKEEDLYKVIDLREKNYSHLNASVGSRAAATRQLVVYFDEEHTSKPANPSFGKKANQQRYRSMLLFNEFKSRSVPPVFSSDVANFRLLRVFALEEVQFDKQTVSGTLFRINLGRVLGSLVYLRYLSVRKTNLLLLPSIQNLVLLQTLKLDVRNDILFPPWLSRNIMGKLGRLRHLYLPDWKVHSLGKNSKMRFHGLNKLETLENVNTQWCEVKGLPKLTGLQKLTLRVDDSYDDVEEVMKCLTAIALSSTSCLRYLVLTISQCDLGSRNGPDILRKLLSDHKYNLQELKVIGQLPELAQLFEQQQLHDAPIDLSLIHITRLHLMLSFLEEDPMPVLEKIHTLRELLIHRKAFMGRELVCSATGFPKLTRLVLRNLPNLVKWRVEEHSMPVLSHLMIRNCLKLKELPEGIKFLHSLEELRVEVMPQDFYERLKVVNGAKYSIVVDID